MARTQRDAIQSGSEAAIRALQFPLEQTVEFQRGAAKMFIEGLEAQEQAQRRTLDISKQAFTDYLDAMEKVSKTMAETSRMAVESTAESEERAVQAAAQGFAGAREAGRSVGRAQGSATTPSGYRQGVDIEAPEYRTPDTTGARGYQGGGQVPPQHDQPQQGYGQAQQQIPQQGQQQYQQPQQYQRPQQRYGQAQQQTGQVGQEFDRSSQQGTAGSQRYQQGVATEGRAPVSQGSVQQAGGTHPGDTSERTGTSVEGPPGDGYDESSAEPQQR